MPFFSQKILMSTPYNAANLGSLYLLDTASIVTEIAPSPAYAGIKLLANGTIERKNLGGYVVSATGWHDNINVDASKYEVLANLTFGSLDGTSASHDGSTWLSLHATVEWTREQLTEGGSFTTTLDIIIREKLVPANSVSAVFSIKAESSNL